MQRIAGTIGGHELDAKYDTACAAAIRIRAHRYAIADVQQVARYAARQKLRSRARFDLLDDALAVWSRRLDGQVHVRIPPLVRGDGAFDVNDGSEVEPRWTVICGCRVGSQPEHHPTRDRENRRIAHARCLSTGKSLP
jgi:hypothetical protein